MNNRGLLTWLSSALILGGTAVLGWHYWTLHEAARTQRLAKVLLNRTTAAGQSTPPLEPNKNSVCLGDMIGELVFPASTCQ
jgi:predicted negative regulator of RcsB-dependent stress response